VTKILIVDDSANVRQVVENALTSAETQILSAASGREAIERIELEHPDLVVCDVVMPEPDGYRICEFVKTHPRLGRTPVLLISGAADSNVLEQAARVHSDDVLVKPFHVTELVQKVSDLLTSGGRDEQGDRAAASRPRWSAEGLGGALTQLVTLSGVEWAALADGEGFLIESAGSPGADADGAVAMASWLAESAAGVGRELGRDCLRGLCVDYRGATLFLERVGTSALLVVLLNAPGALAEVRYWIKKACPELAWGI
jgi:twitching motility two-component system response regulator PilH